MNFTMYKIGCDDLDVKYTYVGSSKHFTTRKCQHKIDSKNEKKAHQKLYQVINEHGGWENWTMVKIENITCDSTLDARTRERYWYENLNANMNTNRPMCTTEETKMKHSEWKKQYEIDHKERISARKKQYRFDHKLYLSENKKKYYALNKERISARDAEKIYCAACDSYHCRTNMSQHKKTKKHLANTSQIQN